MRPNHSNRVPTYHVAVDTETVPETPAGAPGESHHRLMIGCARSWRYRDGLISGTTDLDFVTREQWWEWLYGRLVKGTRTWVWAHNAAFDFTVLGLWEEIDEGRLAWKMPRESGKCRGDEGTRDESCPPSLITSPFCFLSECVTPSGASIRFIDTTNFIPISIQKIGPMVGLDKLDRPGETADDFDWLDYCKRDLEILHLAVDRVCSMVRRHDLGNMAITLGGQAMSHYRHRHLTADILTGPEPSIRPLERDGYYGARTNVYFRGRVVESGLEGFALFGRQLGDGPIIYSEPITRIDCNQCYPYVMRNGIFPTKPRHKLRNPSVERLRAALVHGVAVAAVTLWSPNEPWPQRVKGKTSWRVGKVHTVLCGPELVRALAEDVVREVAYAQVYQSSPLFVTWSDEVLAWRREAEARGDVLEAAMLKRMANSLHGKFGQSAEGWETVPGKVPPIPWGEYTEIDGATGCIRYMRAVGNLTQVRSMEPDAKGACPIIAAFVTSYAREHMRECRLAAGPQQVVYEDADSLHVLTDGMERLQATGWLHPSQPGKFKTEAVADSAEYRGPKHYRFGDEEVIPGHALKGRYDARGVWSQTEWVRLDQLLSSGIPESPITVEREMGSVSPDISEGYSDHGWLIYRQGG